MAEIYGLEEFIEEVRAIVPKHLPAGDTLRAVTTGFKKLLNNRSFLREKLNTLDVVGDEACLYEDPDYNFVILARNVSRQAAHQGRSHAGSPHDHGTLWALMGGSPAQHYKLNSMNRSEPFPGLRMISEVPAKAGDFDANEPSNMHLPVFPPEGGNVCSDHRVVEAI